MLIKNLKKVRKSRDIYFLITRSAEVHLIKSVQTGFVAEHTLNINVSEFTSVKPK